MNRRSRNTGRRQVARKPEEEWAVIAVPAVKLERRIREKGYSLRELADKCGHASHSHIYRLARGDVKTTSLRTADLLESLLDARGLFFARMSARSVDRTAA